MPHAALSPLPPLARRRLTATLGAVARLAAAGCSSYRAASPTAPPEVRAAVRVRFAAPRPVATVSGGGDTLEVPGVRALSGDLVSARGDTLVLRVSALEPKFDRAHGRRPTLVRTVGDQVMVRQPDAVRTLLMVVAIPVAAYAAYFLAFALSTGPNY
jgi:hypothetical protein